MAATINFNKEENTMLFRDVDYGDMFYCGGKLLLKTYDDFEHNNNLYSAIDVADGTFHNLDDYCPVKAVEVEINVDFI